MRRLDRTSPFLEESFGAAVQPKAEVQSVIYCNLIQSVPCAAGCISWWVIESCTFKVTCLKY